MAQQITRILYGFLFVAKIEIPYEFFRKEFILISTILYNQPRISAMFSHVKNRRKRLNLLLRNRKNVGLDIYLRGILYVLSYVLFSQQILFLYEKHTFAYDFLAQRICKFLVVHVGLYLPRHVFRHEQMYIAISRVRSKSGLKILICDKNNDSANYIQKLFTKKSFRI